MKDEKAIRSYIEALRENETNYRNMLIKDIGECTSTNIALGYIRACDAILRFITEDQ